MAARAQERPRHFWPVAVASLLWSLFGAFDFVMTGMRNPAYVAQFPPGMIDYLDEMPLWATGAWALGVWGAALGSVLLLRRSRFAVHAFAASLAGLAASTAYQAAGASAAAMHTPPMVAMSALIWIVALAMLGYAARMRRRGALR